MNIVYASNDNYVRHLGVSLYSLFDHNRGSHEMTVYILSVGLSDQNQKKLSSVAKKFNRTLEFIELGNIKDQFSYGVDTGGFDISTLSRLFIGSLLPKSLKRVIYMDCDTVIVNSLMSLWDTNLHGNVLGAVMEPTIYESVKAEINISKKEPYYNAGVLLIDLERWRNRGTEKQMLEFYKAKGGRLFTCDQDVINGVLKGNIKTLSPRYNFFTNYRYFRYESLVTQSESYEIVPKAAFQKAKRYPVVIHYMGDERPWVLGNLNHYRGVYNKYLSLTPWARVKKEKGKVCYMMVYHAMNYITFLCPGFRRFISRNMGMKLVQNRKKAG